MKIIFIYEDFFTPFDEGIKNFAFMTKEALCKDHSVILVRDVQGLPRILNSILLLPRIIIKAGFNTKKIVYIPHGALTIIGWIKSWVLSLLYGDKLSIVDVQRRDFSGWKRFLARKMRLSKVFAMSSPMANDLAGLGVDASIVISGIDRNRFTPGNMKQELRIKYSIPANKRVVLHVGHVRISRNVEWLKSIQEHFSEIQVVLVGSTTTEQDDFVFDGLRDAGVIVLRETIDEIQELYQLADCYCFPVIKKDAAMETPLSVFEAMAVNLPIVTTRFGLLPETFQEDSSFRYVNTIDEMLEVIGQGFTEDCNNRAKTESFTWDATAEQLIGKCLK